jgi:hypothetical protein
MANCPIKLNMVLPLIRNFHGFTTPLAQNEIIKRLSNAIVGFNFHNIVLYSKVLSGRFPFPADPGHQRMVHSDGPTFFFMTVKNTGATVKALIRVQHNGRVLLLRVRNEHIHRAYIDASVTSVTGILVEYDRPAWCRRIWAGIDRFLLVHICFSKSGLFFWTVCFIIGLQVAPKING